MDFSYTPHPIHQHIQLALASNYACHKPFSNLHITPLDPSLDSLVSANWSHVPSLI